MPTEIEVCNRALLRVGANPLSTSLTDVSEIDPSVAGTSTEAKVTSAVYDMVRDIVLEDRIWTFASQRVQATGYEGYIENNNPFLTANLNEWDQLDEVTGEPDPALVSWTAADYASSGQPPGVALVCTASVAADPTNPASYTARGLIRQYVECSGYGPFEIKFDSFGVTGLPADGQIEVKVGTTAGGSEIASQLYDVPAVGVLESFTLEIDVDGPFYIEYLASSSDIGTKIVPVYCPVASRVLSDTRYKVFALPSDLIVLHRVANPTADYSNPEVQDYRKEGNFLLVRNRDSVYIDYIRRNADLSQWTPKAVDCLVIRLAQEYAISLTENRNLLDQLQNEYEKRLTDAGASDGSQAKSERFKSSSLITARLYGGNANFWWGNS